GAPMSHGWSCLYFYTVLASYLPSSEHFPGKGCRALYCCVSVWLILPFSYSRSLTDNLLQSQCARSALQHTRKVVATPFGVVYCCPRWRTSRLCCSSWFQCSFLPASLGHSVEL